MTLWIQQADKSYLPINGYIHTARRLGDDGSLSSYQVAFASWMYFLKFRSDMLYWQDKSVDAIIVTCSMCIHKPKVSSNSLWQSHCLCARIADKCQRITRNDSGACSELEYAGPGFGAHATTADASAAN